MDWARQQGIATAALYHKDYPSREAFDAALAQEIDRHAPDYVLLAGFMRVLTPGFVNHYAGRLVNIHPSLLPAFPGLHTHTHTHAQALATGVRAHGCTVHFVTPVLDHGPIIAQGCVPVLAGDTPEALAGRARCLVAHPMTPPHLSPVVEMAASAWTDPQALAGAETFMRSLGQHPVRIRKEIPGFVLNRLQGALLMEMFRVIADDVISPADADALISQGLGLRWATLGPLEGVDLNAPGGIADYLQRYGHIFNDMAAGQGLPAPVDAELISALD
ncbi:phosphoribosylglycinamide formyltransferase, partial [Bordetella pertussis]